MSTARRQLGTGPSTTRSTTTDIAPRLLPVERAQSGAPLGAAEHKDVVARKGRRNLGQPGAQLRAVGASVGNGEVQVSVLGSEGDTLNGTGPGIDGIS